jgi:hypothetical protein
VSREGSQDRHELSEAHHPQSQSWNRNLVQFSLHRFHLRRPKGVPGSSVNTLEMILWGDKARRTKTEAGWLLLSSEGVAKRGTSS